MQSPYTDPAEVWKRIPEHNQQTIRDKKIRVYLLPTWSRSPARWPRRPTCRCACRASCCWARSCKLTPYARESDMTDEQVYAGVEKALRKYFGKRGDRVVQDNLTCVKRGYSEMKEIPRGGDSDRHDNPDQPRDFASARSRSRKLAANRRHPGAIR